MNIKKVLKKIKSNQYIINLFLLAIVIIASSALIIRYFSNRSGKTIPSIDTNEVLQLPTIHEVQKGESLWQISEKYYGSGYNFVDIAKENKISNPNLIAEKQKLTIPDVEPKLVSQTPTISPSQSPTITPTPIPFEKGAHIVEKGESLWKISEKYYGSGYNFVDIAKENNLKNPNLVYENQELKIPQVEPRLVTSILNAALTDKSAIDGTSYTVVKGDNLWDIAVRAYGDGYKWVEIARQNNLSNPNLIHPGNILVIPR